ncbi:hypothetical protein BKA70DRAFT_1285921 [Coprinopsis sp. MPI-PUGE-AT-0042]|nr:hypothetical protein BKA70DRAFT_1285921 [Coprinopsis sp. MPI-PUGE-AT-0042]
MQISVTSLFITLSVALGVLAGQNCKCQASNGQGPQWNGLTDYCCRGNGGTGYFPGPNNQCSAGGTNCLNSGAFVRCCQENGAPSAFCWG